MIWDTNPQTQTDSFRLGDVEYEHQRRTQAPLLVLVLDGGAAEAALLK